MNPIKEGSTQCTDFEAMSDLKWLCRLFWHNPSKRRKELNKQIKEK